MSIWQSCQSVGGVLCCLPSLFNSPFKLLSSYLDTVLSMEPVSINVNGVQKCRVSVNGKPYHDAVRLCSSDQDVWRRTKNDEAMGAFTAKVAGRLMDSTNLDPATPVIVLGSDDVEPMAFEDLLDEGYRAKFKSGEAYTIFRETSTKGEVTLDLKICKQKKKAGKKASQGAGAPRARAQGPAKEGKV